MNKLRCSGPKEVKPPVCNDPRHTKPPPIRRSIPPADFNQLKCREVVARTPSIPDATICVKIEVYLSRYGHEGRNSLALFFSNEFKIRTHIPTITRVKCKDI